MVILGSLYAFTSLATDLQGYGFADVAVLGSLGNVGAYCGAVVSGALLDRAGGRVTALAATALAVAGWLGLRFSLTQADAAPVAVSLAVIGLAGSTGFMGVSASVYAVFAPEHRGRLSGLLLAFYSLSAAVWAPVYNAYFAGGAQPRGPGWTLAGLPGYCTVMALAAAAAGSVCAAALVNHKAVAARRAASGDTGLQQQQHATVVSRHRGAVIIVGDHRRHTRHPHDHDGGAGDAGGHGSSEDEAHHSSAGGHDAAEPAAAAAAAADEHVDEHTPISGGAAAPPGALSAGDATVVARSAGAGASTGASAARARAPAPLPAAAAVSAARGGTPSTLDLPTAPFAYFPLAAILCPCQRTERQAFAALATVEHAMHHQHDHHSDGGGSGGGSQSHTEAAAHDAPDAAAATTAAGAATVHLERAPSDGFMHHDGTPSNAAAAGVFYALYAATAVTIGGALCFLNNISLSLKAAAAPGTSGVSDSVWTAVLAFALANTGARAGGGLLTDLLASHGRSRLLVFAVAVAAVTAGVIVVAVAPVRGMVVAAVLVGAGDGAAFATWPVVVAELYGHARYGLMFAVVNTSLGGGSLALNAMASALYRSGGGGAAGAVVTTDGGQVTCHGAGGECYRTTWVVTAALVAAVGAPCLAHLYAFQTRYRARLLLVAAAVKSVG